ncbi:site-2 protease family protein [Pseudaminobacter sp. 19-2017]|uniref:Zinc metalloprotease n=1 Tax=Pseudaminobacter soli (ex Zhang et al. 2022) TaxID=2831468 RepID=A0A942E7F2_9HYPH|nr:site-2 protease family protein [Pseudaminobacter soli]MBS3652508.1 site-2 protease family protein [Pseudaminobacter soli]
MQWSYPILRIGSTEIRIHLTFVLLLAWIAIAYFQAGGTSAAVEGVGFVAAVFACVVLHELGHAAAARRYGIRTPKITLLPIGGVAQLERLPEKPSEEIVVAVAGPLVNVVIAAFLVVVLGTTVGIEALTSMEDPRVAFVARLTTVNVWLVLFNLIPAFPMDGGRVLRALLAMRYSRVRATEIAGTIGQFAAFAFGFIGLVSGNVLLIFVAIFVYLAATAETQAVGLQDAARAIAIRDVMISRFESLPATASLNEAAQVLLRTTQHEFPIVDGAGRLRGVLTREGLVAGLQQRGSQAPVVEAMAANIPVIRDNEKLSTALAHLQKREAPAVGVLDARDNLIGYVTVENIGELMMLRSAVAR